MNQKVGFLQLGAPSTAACAFNLIHSFYIFI